jgi:high affinity Mn2+ porin
LTLDYQFAQDPAYNHVRGPVDLLAMRFHTEF